MSSWPNQPALTVSKSHSPLGLVKDGFVFFSSRLQLALFCDWLRRRLALLLSCLELFDHVASSSHAKGATVDQIEQALTVNDLEIVLKVKPVKQPAIAEPSWSTSAIAVIINPILNGPVSALELNASLSPDAEVVSTAGSSLAPSSVPMMTGSCSLKEVSWIMSRLFHGRFRLEVSFWTVVAGHVSG